jgi:hypothetical protein
VDELEERRWEFLLREHQDLRSADQSFVQQTAALLSVAVVTAAAVTVSLEKLSGSTPHHLPGWVWPLFPLPMLGVLALLVFLQAASNLRTHYAEEIEEGLRRRVRFGEDFMFPSLFLMRKEGWHYSKSVRFPPLLVAFWIALLTILTVIVAINVVCIKLTRPDWLQVLSGALEAILWISMTAIYIPNLTKQYFWVKAQPARTTEAARLKKGRITPPRKNS